ncbi:hypothetical protein FBU59_006574 [Linderina macrospora]|uniref:Uncharacterized protein n=1 Tax=Linderina macrospora TaxID=4868 RepID=A0ACC1IZH8_9FUNG|nr:hypothetical protein FBU59_006574 [Linderina macrospora]
MLPEYRPIYGNGYHYPNPVTNTLRTELFSTTDLNPLAQYESRDVTELSTVVIHPAVPTSWIAANLPPIVYPTKPANLNADERPDTQQNMLAKRQYFTPTTYTNYRSVDYTKTEVIGPISVSTEVDIVNGHHETTIVPPGIKIAYPPAPTSKQATLRPPARKGASEPQELRKRWYGFESTITDWISHATYSTVVLGSPVMIEERTNTEYWDQTVSPPSLFATPPPTLTVTLPQPTPTKPSLAKRYYGDSTVTNSIYDVTRISKVLDKDISTATYIVNESVGTTIINPVRSNSDYYP